MIDLSLQTPLRALFSLSLAALTLAGCGGEASPEPEDAQARTPLHVALYPFIPDAASDHHAALLARIESDFEKQNADIDLVLRPLSTSDGFYDQEQLEHWLADPPGEGGGYHVLEIDTVLLGALAKRGLLGEWSAKEGTEGFHPAALAAATTGGVSRGVPRWMCGFYVISRDPAIASAASFDALIAAVSSAGSAAPRIAGNMISSWDLPSMYLSAWADTYGNKDLAGALAKPVDDKLAERLGALGEQCEAGSENDCVDGTFYDEWDLPAQRFAKGEIPAMYGYSERLHVVLAAGADPAEIALGKLPLGPAPKPVSFVDALVRRADCVGACADAADRFASYLVEPSTFAWVLMSEDASGAPPRYLLPAREDAYEQPALKADPFYPALRASMEGAVPYPNGGIPEAKDTMFKALCSELPEGAACEH